MVVSPLVVNSTVSPLTLLPLASVTKAVPVDCDTPSAGIDVGLSETATLAAGPGFAVSDFVSLGGFDAADVWALIVWVSALVVVMTQPYVPSPLFVPAADV